LRDEGKLTPEQMNPFAKPRLAEELYDTEADPHELKNLADDPKYADELKKMRGILDAWIKETGDGLPKERTPDEFDRETGERKPDAPTDGRKPKPGQPSGHGQP